MSKTIVVFAGSECVKDRENFYYKIAYNTGKFLAQNGFVTATGGGPGLMNEVCRGAFENGGKTIGICLDLPGRIHSKFLTRSVHYTRLNQRQKELIKLGNGFISLPGGVGTVYEIAAILVLKRKGEIPKNYPLILVDNYFDIFISLIQKMEKEGFVNGEFSNLYRFAENPREAIDILNLYWSLHRPRSPR